MVINKTIMSSEVKDAFNAKFPGLKIEFFRQGHQQNQMSAKDDMVQIDVMLEELNAELKEGELELNPQNSAIQFEDELMERFGLNTQVFRKSNNLWLQTSSTDHWSLEEHNRKGINSQQ